MARPRDTIEARNYRRVLVYLLEQVGNPELVITEDMIRRINGITLRDVPNLWGPPGEYKHKPNYVVDRATDSVTYRPPGPEDTQRLMEEFVSWINRNLRARRDDPQNLTLHPVVLAAIACHQINHIHPFCDGNGRTARAVATLVLMYHGYMGIQTGDRLRPVKSLEWFFDEHRQEYVEALSAADNDAYGPWVHLFSLAVLETMERIDRDQLAIVREKLDVHTDQKKVVAD